MRSSARVSSPGPHARPRATRSRAEASSPAPRVRLERLEASLHDAQHRIRKLGALPFRDRAHELLEKKRVAVRERDDAIDHVLRHLRAQDRARETVRAALRELLEPQLLNAP